MVTRADILKQARSYLGAQWRHQGRSAETGLDCAGMVALVGYELGLIDSDVLNYRDYPRRPDGTFVNLFRQYAKFKPLHLATDGDILIFSQGKHACHAGIRSTYRGHPGVIHAHASMKQVIEQTLDTARDTAGRPSYCFEFPGVED